MGGNAGILLLRYAVIVLLMLTLATQVFAAQREQHPALGAPALQMGVLKFYAPWQGVQWAWRWFPTAPHLFLASGSLVGGGTLGVSIAMSCLRSRTAPRVLAQWSTPARLRRARLLRRQGVVVGRLP